MANKFMVGDKVQTIKVIDRSADGPYEVTHVFTDGRIDFGGRNPNKRPGFDPDIFELVCNKHGVPGNKLVTFGEVAMAGFDESITTTTPDPALSECNPCREIPLSERSLISMDKEYTINGEPVRVLCVDRRGNWTTSPVVAFIERTGVMLYFDEYGTNILSSCSNLVEVKPRIKRKVWVNVYQNNGNGSGIYYRSREAAEDFRVSGCVACVELVIDVEEGEGL